MSHHVGERGLFFGENEGTPAGTETVMITVENERGRAFRGKTKTAVPNGDENAGDEADKVVGPGQLEGFVEVVDAPGETAFFVAPRSKILEVQIADADGMRGFSEIGANVRPQLSPAVE